MIWFIMLTLCFWSLTCFQAALKPAFPSESPRLSKAIAIIFGVVTTAAAAGALHLAIS